MQSNQLVLVGAEHWIHPAWSGAYYPTDLPADWLLSYYNTQFQAVYLSAEAWQGADEQTWDIWLSDTQADFHFVLEAASGAIFKPESSRVHVATPEWMAAHVWWLDDAPDLRALAQRINQQAALGEPVFVFSRSGNLDLLEQVGALKQVLGY